VKAKNNVFKVEGLQLGLDKKGRIQLGLVVRAKKDVKTYDHNSTTYYLSHVDSHFASLNLSFLN
jgi:hypothetical protein